MTTCDRMDDLRDYAMGELAADARAAIERHIAGCGECAAELAALQLTTAALRAVPDREIPQRIGFVSDRIFEPSPVSRWFSGFWNSAARLGFAAACVLSVALVVTAYHRPASNGAGYRAVEASLSKADVDREVDQAVANAVAKVRKEDSEINAKAMAAALAESDRKHEKQNQALLVAMEENLTVMQKRLSTFTMLASNDTGRPGDLR